ncbi:unnamed protein product [Dibothriocephalus latus]|uniref:Uncharacterized protein n=1 Tax=Dibothriocephalus latus TaxID=60516 RepID=A0A3P7LEB9_DIBLA|nr:unnamed protein product [Dibothriocephalus latus]
MSRAGEAEKGLVPFQFMRWLEQFSIKAYRMFSTEELPNSIAHLAAALTDMDSGDGNPLLECNAEPETTAAPQNRSCGLLHVNKVLENVNGSLHPRLESEGDLLHCEPKSTLEDDAGFRMRGRFTVDEMHQMEASQTANTSGKHFRWKMGKKSRWSLLPFVVFAESDDD